MVMLAFFSCGIQVVSLSAREWVFSQLLFMPSVNPFAYRRPGSASWCHITSTILSCVEIRGRLCNVDAAWDAKSRHCDIGGIFSATAVYSTSDSWQFSLILYHSSSY
ncbi:uncharacterized protein LOC103829365 [Brassica rapa]|uniref:uncharacterized protein LOC103829365 n=1 Tax=Brassica campestris TaxID=3711 RepID=UPI0004F1D12F|nr:uncharacterized protein LOC103829365 [Brassica rapa]